MKIPVSRRNKKRTNIYIPRQTSMDVGVYDCIRTENESESGNQLSSILTKANKQTCILVCLYMYVCMQRKNESASRSSTPLFKGVRVISACVCAHARVLVLFR